MRTLGLLAACAVAAAVPEPVASAQACDRITVADGRFVDACGRQRLLRGINSVIKGVPWIANATSFVFGGGSLSPADAALLQSLGMNVVRLGIMWSGVAPAPGVVDTSLTAAYASLSATLFRDNGIYTLLDAHQDLLSPAFCGDGLPAWLGYAYGIDNSSSSAAVEARGLDAAAAVPNFPAPLAPPCNYTNGSVTPGGSCCALPLGWGTYYFTEAVSRGFGTLYSPRGVTDMAAFWAAVLAAYAEAEVGPAALGLQLLNEPWPGDVFADPLLLIPGLADGRTLQPFFMNVSANISATLVELGLPPIPIVSDTVTWDDFFSSSFTALPGADAGLAVLSYHYYSLPNIEGPAWQAAARAADARRLNAVPWLTEFDVDLLNPVNPPYSALDLRATLAAMDAAGHGYIGWAWESLWDGQAGGLVIPALRELARPFPAAVAGIFNASAGDYYAFDAAGTGNWSAAYTHDCDAGAAGATEVFLSTAFWFPGLTPAAVTVEASAPGAVQWSLTATPGASEAALAAWNVASGTPPPALAYATLSIASSAQAGACPAGTRVTVRVLVTATAGGE